MRCNGMLVVATLATAFVAGSAGAADEAALRSRATAVFGVLPESAPNPRNPMTAEKVALGRMLYYDTRLSKNHDISCNTCHHLDAFGVDGKPTSPGHKGQLGVRNSPTTFNAALHIAEFWDGRAADVEEQAKGPVLNPVEMAMPSKEAVETTLRSIPGYRERFAAAFPNEAQPVTFDNAALAIGAFERGLTTPAPFDAWLRGDDAALTPQQLRGLGVFMDAGCITCHNGPTVGGRMFQKLGLVHPYQTKDVGRFAVTHNEADRTVFKVPSLRNVARTAPYFHDGSVKTLDEAVRKMGWHQLGLELSDAQVADIVAFLQSLTGKVDSSYVAEPKLPASGPGTPPADPT